MSLELIDLHGRIELEPDHACDNQRQAKDPDRVGRLAEQEDADDDASGGTDPGPHGIGRAERQRFQCNRHQGEAQDDGKHGRARRPEPRQAIGIFQADGPADLQQSRRQQCQPRAHGRSHAEAGTTYCA